MSPPLRITAYAIMLSMESVYASRAAGGAPVVLPVVERSCVMQDWPRAGLAGRVWRGQAAPLAGRTSTKDKREWQRIGKENLMNIHTT